MSVGLANTQPFPKKKTTKKHHRKCASKPKNKQVQIYFFIFQNTKKKFGFKTAKAPSLKFKKREKGGTIDAIINAALVHGSNARITLVQMIF